MGVGGGTLLTGWRGKMIKDWTFRIADAHGYIERAAGTTGLVIDVRNDPLESAVPALAQFLIGIERAESADVPDAEIGKTIR
jgi:hypothetical protein